MSNPIRIGLVGLGRAGMHGHLPELAGYADRFVVVAGYDPIPERLAELREKTGARGHESIDALVADPEVELVDVANRSVDHFTTVSRALDAGKMALVEKPMSVTLGDARRLVERDRELGGGRLFVRHNRRFDPDFVHLREIIASGVLGTVYEVKLRRHQFSRRNDWQTVREFGGGQLLNWGAHVVDHALQLLDGPVASVWSDIKRVAAAGDAEDHVHIILRGEPLAGGSGEHELGGRIVDLEISGGVAIGEPVYQVYGTRGTLTGSPSEFTLKYLNPDVELTPREVDLAPPQGYGSGETLDWVEQTLAVAPSVDETMWDGLYAAIREDGEYPITNEQALEVMRVIDQAHIGTAFER
jgi:scyllo-inositol 2-dehydrogenase (NADP+)